MKFDNDFYESGFFNPYEEVQISRRKLPHWVQKNVWYFITFRLADSIPKHKKEEIRKARELWKKEYANIKRKAFTKADWILYNKLFHENVEKLLNAGYGKCWMKKKENADIVANALLYFKKERYLLDEWVVMPNHVHVLVKPLENYYIGDILHSWKSFTANQINKREGLAGQLWMSESYNHIVRNKKAFKSIGRYINLNPEKAGISVYRRSSNF